MTLPEITCPFTDSYVLAYSNEHVFYEIDQLELYEMKESATYTFERTGLISAAFLILFLLTPCVSSLASAYEKTIDAISQRLSQADQPDHPVPSSPTTPSCNGKFCVGDRVTPGSGSGGVNICPETVSDATCLIVIPMGQQGTVKAVADVSGKNWVHVVWNSQAFGWTGENSLDKVGATANSTPTPGVRSPAMLPATGSTPSVGDYYVSTDGNDRNTGTVRAPFKTLQKAIPLLKPGQTLIVRGGEYDTVNGLIRTDGSGLSIIPSGASWDKPVTIKAAEGERVTFRRYVPRGAAVTELNLQTTRAARMPTLAECQAEAKRLGVALQFPGTCFSASGSGLSPGNLPPVIDPATLPGYVLDLSAYNTLNNLIQYIVFDGINFDARGIVRGLLSLGKAAQHIRFQNVEIQNAIQSCVSNLADDSDRGVEVDHQWIKVTIHHCGVPYDTNMVGSVLAREHPSTRFFQTWYYHVGGVLWDGVVAYKNAGAAISPLGKNNVVRNGYFHDNNAQGIIVYCYPFPNCGWQITNNVFVNHPLGIQIDSLVDVNLSNNVIVSSRSDSISLYGVYINTNACGPINIQNNIITGYQNGIYSGQQKQTWCGVPRASNNLIISTVAGHEINDGSAEMKINKASNILGQDPRFANPAAGNYHVQSGSPAIGKGSNGENIGVR